MEKETLYRFFRGETTPDEQQCLMDWLDADEEHRRTFDRERQMYNALLCLLRRNRLLSVSRLACGE